MTEAETIDRPAPPPAGLRPLHTASNQYVRPRWMTKRSARLIPVKIPPPPAMEAKNETKRKAELRMRPMPFNFWVQSQGKAIFFLVTSP